MRNRPEISIVTCTFNGARTIKDFFKGILMQDYPIKNLEIIMADGGSTDGTLKTIRLYKKRYPKIISLFSNPHQYAEGKGMGKDMASKRARGDFILFLDQDNILVQKDWLSRMINILKRERKISAVQSQIISPRSAPAVDRYLSLIGIEDPFAIPYSLLSQISLRPKQFKLDKKINCYLYEVSRKDFLYAGNNGFLIRRREFFENGGYTQDIDNFYRMASRKVEIAVPLGIGLHHRSSEDFMHFLKKRSFYVSHYLLKNISGRDFYWFSLSKNTAKQNLKFLKNVIYNLLILPGAVQGIRLAVRDKEPAWLMHPVMLFSVTLSYIYCFIRTRLSKTEKPASI